MRDIMASKKEYKFKAELIKNPDMDASYIIFPYDIRDEFNKGRVKVHAEFDGEPYDGSIVNMGVKDSEGNIWASFFNSGVAVLIGFFKGAAEQELNCVIL